MPAVLAIPMFWGAVAAGTGAAATVYAAHKASESNDKAIDYTKSKDAQDLQIANATQHANYDQWAAREARLSSLGQMVGLPARNIPAFSPLPGAVDRVPGPNGASNQATGDPQAYFNTLFPGQTLTPDMLAGQEQALNAKGIKLLRNAAGRPGKIVLPNGSAVDVIEGAGSGLNRKQWLVQAAGGSPTATPFTPNWANGGGYLSPMGGMLTPNAPALAAPQPWQPRTMGDFLGRN